jgi:hypothetical protein
MHPIERLRAVARAGWAPADVLASEAAWALAALGVHEPPALVPACRRLLARHPGCGPLWWLSARVLSAGDPVAEAETCALELDADVTPEQLDEAVGVRRAVRRGGMGEIAAADVVVVPVDAVGPGGMVIDVDARGLVEGARAVEVPIWVEAGVGRLLPPRLWEAMTERLRRDPIRAGTGGVLESLAGVDRIVDRSGARPTLAAVSDVDCPEPSALLGPW